MGLRRGQCDDRQAEVHGLEQGEPEARPAVRVDVQAPTRHRGVQLGLREVADAAERLAVDAEEVVDDVAADAVEEIRAGDPPTALGLVHDDRGPRQGAVVQRARIDDAVLDDAGRRPLAIPEQVVEVRDVDDRQVVASGGRVLEVGDVALRRVVLHPQRRQITARPLVEPAIGQDRIARALEQDHVELLVPQAVQGNLASSRRPVVGLRPAAAVGAAIRGERDDVVVVALHERRGPGAMHVPDEDPHRRTR